MSNVRNRPAQQSEPLFKGHTHATRVVGPRSTELTLQGTIRKSEVEAPTPPPVLVDTPENIIKAYLTSE